MTETLLRVALVLFLIAIAITAGIALTFWLWRWRRPLGQLVVFLLFGALGIQLYQAFFPPDSFYRDEFERNAHMAFPESGRILARSASFPDHFGDYCAAAVFEVDDTDWGRLAAAAAGQDHAPRRSVGSACINAIGEQLGTRLAIARGPQRLDEGGWFFEWGPLGAERRLMFHFLSW